MQGKKILFVSDGPIIKSLIQLTAKKLINETGAQFDCLVTSETDDSTLAALRNTFDQVYVNEHPKGFLKQLPKARGFQVIYGLWRLVKKLGHYDIIHIHFHHYYYSFCTPIFRKKARKVFVSFLGCDFNLISDYRHWHNRKTVKLVDGVFAENETFLKNIMLRYNTSLKAKQTGILIPFKSIYTSFEAFFKNNTNASAKALWHFEKGVIVCGYNAALITQHEVIIDALNGVKNKLSGYEAIFPMAYGGTPEVRAKIKEKLKASFLDGQVLEEYLTGEKLMALRLAADIFIHIASRDQMAHSMLEHLAAGSVVITGNWLPYKSLVEKGIYFIQIETPNDLPRVLSSVIDHLEVHKEKSKVNREIILHMMKWENIKTNWFKYYELNENQ